MDEPFAAPRSRRALLAAAAGGAAALAASAALPLTAAAHDPDDVQLGAANASTTATTITNATADVDAFGGAAAGTGVGISGTSTGGSGLWGWSISAPPGWEAAFGAYTGVYGWSPASPTTDTVGTGVFGDSDDWGVYGQGTVGVYGYGSVGVIGESDGPNAGVIAIGASSSSPALEVIGKAKFSRSGRTTLAKGKSSLKVTLAGTTTSSHVFAVLGSVQTGRYVRAVVPSSGSFTVYLNSAATANAFIHWFVIN
jgi:hypothetical protein